MFGDCFFRAYIKTITKYREYLAFDYIYEFEGGASTGACVQPVVSVSVKSRAPENHTQGARPRMALIGWSYTPVNLIGPREIRGHIFQR